MRLSYRPAALAALASLAFATPGSAAIFNITWEGTLSGGTYTLDSNPTVDITGTAFKVVYTIDDSLGTTTGSTPPSFSTVFGGTGFGEPTHPVSAMVTIVGIGSFALSGREYSLASRTDYTPVGAFPDAATYQVEDQINEVVAGVDHHRTSSVFSFLTEANPASYGTLFDSLAFDGTPTRVRAPSDVSIFAFQWNDILTDLSSGDTEQIFVEAQATNGWIVASAAVPEPATWAMMIGGFALVGSAMRRRKATVAFA